jgi:hypothetical protein
MAKKIFFSFENIIGNLNNITNIKEYDKLIIYEKNFEIDNRYMQSILRMINNDNRIDTINFFKNLINECILLSNNLINNILITSSLEDIKYHKLRLKNLSDSLLYSINGFDKLKITYDSDIIICSDIDNIIKNIRTIYTNNHNLDKTNIKYILKID